MNKIEIHKHWIEQLDEYFAKDKGDSLTTSLFFRANPSEGDAMNSPNRFTVVGNCYDDLGYSGAGMVMRQLHANEDVNKRKLFLAVHEGIEDISKHIRIMTDGEKQKTQLYVDSLNSILSLLLHDSEMHLKAKEIVEKTLSGIENIKPYKQINNPEVENNSHIQ